MLERAAAQAAGGDAVLLAAGDSIGASLFASSVAQDQPTIDVLNALQLRASAVGNHEFDQGFDDLAGRVIDNGAKCQVEVPGRQRVRAWSILSTAAVVTMVAVARPRAGSSSDRLGGTFGQIAFPVQQNTGEPRRTVRRRVPGTAGPNIDQPVSVSPVAGEVAGTYLAEYTTLPPSVIETTTGADTLQAFVDHTPGTAALDPREPSDTATSLSSAARSAPSR